MPNRTPLALALFLVAGVAASRGECLTYRFSTPIAGDSVAVTAELVDVDGGTRIAVSIPPGQGDLLGVFGNVHPEGAASSMGLTDASGVVTQWQFEPSQVRKVGAGNTLLPVEGWDWGVKLGATGSGGGVVESAAFVLTGVSVSQLTAAVNQGWLLGVRIQGTQPLGSAKLGLAQGTLPVESPPTITIASPADGAFVPRTFLVGGTVVGSGATVSVNGEPATVAGGTWSASLTLPDGSHTLVATATNAGGASSASVTVSVDATGPEITITAPASGTPTRESPIVVSGTVRDASAVASVAIDGVPCAVSAGAFTGSAALVEGSNTLEVTALDAHGNPGSASLSVTLDSTPPRVTIDAPPDGALTPLSILEVSGEVTDASPIVALTVNGADASLAGTRYSASLTLPVGATLITANAIDAAGNAGVAKALVTRGEPPTIAITAPAPGLLTNGATVSVSGMAVGADEVRVNGVAAALSGGVWTAAAPLAEGPNPISAVATNAFGSARAETGVTRDSLPPVVTITAPQDLAEFTAADITVTGIVDDASPILALDLNGAALPAALAFSAPFTLGAGANTLTVSAADLAGNVGRASVSALLRSGALSIEMTAPAEGSVVASSRIDAGGTVSDARAAVRVNGVLATVTGSRWVARGIPLAEGNNQLTAMAEGGSQTASDVAQIVHRPAPEIAITSPRDGAVMRGETIEVTGVVSTAAALIDVNGVPASVDSAGRFFATQVPIAPGENELVARAVDLRGAVAADRAVVERDDASAPQLRVFVVYPQTFAPWGLSPITYEPRADATRLLAWSDDAEYLAGLRGLGRSPEAYDPPLTGGVIGWWEPAEVYVLSESPDPPDLEVLQPDGAVASGVSSVPISSGPIEDLSADLASLSYPLPDPSPLSPVDLAPLYFHHLRLTGFGEVPSPLTLRAKQGEAEDTLEVRWDARSAAGDIAAPLDTALVSKAELVVSGSMADDVAVANVFWDAVNFPPSHYGLDVAEGEAFVRDGRYLIADGLLAPGSNLFYVYAYDAGGAEVEADSSPIRVHVDPTAPDVALANPMNGQALIESSASLGFNFGVPLTVVSINGAPINRAFLAGYHGDLGVMALELGANPIEVVVDSGSGARTLSFVLYRVERLEGIEITSPSDAGWVNERRLRVEGTVPLGTPYVEVNGVAAVIEPNGVRWAARIPVPQTDTILGETDPRPYRITAIAYPQGDAASVAVKPDFTPPSFGSVLPANGALLAEASATYRGWLDEVATVSAVGAGPARAVQTTPGTAALLLDGFAWARRTWDFVFANLPLAEGPNSLTLTARDRAGNASTTTVSVERLVPAVALVSPAAGASVADLATDLVFFVAGDVIVDALFSGPFYVPGASGLALASGTHTLAGVPLAPAENELRLVYHRPGGAQQSLRFVLWSDAENAAVVTGVVSDARTGQPVSGALVSLTVDGRTLVVASDANGRYRGLVAPGTVVGSVYASLYDASAFEVSVASGQVAVADSTLAYTGVASLGNELRILVPPEGAVTDWERVQVVGTVLRSDAVVTVNGVPAEVVGNRFTARGVELSPGSNAIRARADALGGPPVTTERAVERSETPVLDVEIFSPPDGATIPGNGLVVRGWVSAKDAVATAVGSLGIPDEGVFSAYDVLVSDAESRIAARAERPNGESAEDGISVSFAGREPALALSISPATGVAPLRAQLTVASRLSLDVGRLDFDFDADGAIDRLGSPEPSVSHEYAVPASPEARVFLTTPMGVELTAHARVHAHLEHAAGGAFAAGNPVDLAEAPNADLFVLDRSAGLVRRFRADGTLVSELAAGAGLRLPEAMDSDAARSRLAVADTGNSRVVVLDALGGILAAFGTHGAGEGQLASPRGVGLARDLVAVADSGNDRVQVFRDDGTFLGAVPFSEPRAIEAISGSTFLVTSPSAGVRVLDVRGSELRLLTPGFARVNDAHQLPGAPSDIATGLGGLLIADLSGPRVWLYGGQGRVARVIEAGLPGRPLALLGSHRRDTPAIYLADGERVHELLLPVPSPLPVAVALRERMRAGDAAGVLALMHPLKRPLFDRMHQALGSRLSAYGNAIGGLRVDLLREEEAIVRAEFTDADGVVLQLPISFVRKSDGSWLVSDY